MDSVRTLLPSYLRAAWRRRWMGVTVAWLVCGVGWVGVYTIPNQFESTARLFVDADAILTPLLRGIAADFCADHAAGNPAAHAAQQAEPGKAGFQDRPRSDAEQPVGPGTADDPVSSRYQSDAADQEPVHHLLSRPEAPSWRMTWCRRC